jgi:hypothetical protein
MNLSERTLSWLAIAIGGGLLLLAVLTSCGQDNPNQRCYPGSFGNPICDDPTKRDK